MGLSRRRRNSAARRRLGPSILSKSSSQTSRRAARRLGALIPLFPAWSVPVPMDAEIAPRWLKTGFQAPVFPKRYPHLGSGETFPWGREAGLKRILAINDPDQTTGFDHVGIHPQCNLSPISQKLAVRNEHIKPAAVMRRRADAPPRTANAGPQGKARRGSQRLRCLGTYRR